MHPVSSIAVSNASACDFCCPQLPPLRTAPFRDKLLTDTTTCVGSQPRDDIIKSATDALVAEEAENRGTDGDRAESAAVASTSADSALFHLVYDHLRGILRIKRLAGAEAKQQAREQQFPVCRNPDGFVPSRITCRFRFNRKIGGAGATTLAQCFLMVRAPLRTLRLLSSLLEDLLCLTFPHACMPDPFLRASAHTLAPKTHAEHGGVTACRALHPLHLAEPPSGCLQQGPVFGRDIAPSGNRQKGTRAPASCAAAGARIRNSGGAWALCTSLCRLARRQSSLRPPARAPISARSAQKCSHSSSNTCSAAKRCSRFLGNSRRWALSSAQVRLLLRFRLLHRQPCHLEKSGCALLSLSHGARPLTSPPPRFHSLPAMPHYPSVQLGAAHTGAIRCRLLPPLEPRTGSSSS